jgi:hypothetical protein
MQAVGAGGVIHSASPVEAVFGLGKDTVEVLEIAWPSGRQSTLNRPPAGELVVEEPVE